MDFSIEKYISTFIENQFPQFYQEDGENFILFVKAYYEWLEASGNPVGEARNIFDYRDIDNTLSGFLEFFQKKYLYGIPFNVIANKRFLLKHILDVYRSKGTIQCYKLLFRLIYNEDIEMYLPGLDVLRASDGTWVEPKYLEVTNTGDLTRFIGKSVVGSSSGTTAIVESYTRENVYNDIIDVLYISNILPLGGDFEIGELVMLQEEVGTTKSTEQSPIILGSLDTLQIVNGGQGFNVGDIVKIAHTDITTGNVSSFGVDGLLKVTSLSRAFGSLNIEIIRGGFGFMANSMTFLYNNINDTNGQVASFQIGSIVDAENVYYNTDIICDYMSLTLDSTAYGFPGNTSANLTSTIETSFSWTNNVFGKLNTLTSVKTGNNYNAPANTFTRSMQISKVLPGTVSYSNTNFCLYTISSSNAAATGYNNTDIITIVNTDGGTNATITVTTNNTGGNLNLTISNRGSGFKTANPTITVSNSSSTGNTSNGVGATFATKYLRYISGSGTNFNYIFANDDVIFLQANSLLDSTVEYQVIKQVVNSSVMMIYGNTKYSSTASAQYRASPSIFPSSFAIYEPLMSREDGSINGLNDIIQAVPSIGNNVVGTLKVLNSGKAYIEQEYVKAYLYGAISSDITFITRGSGYSNGDLMVFSGGEPTITAKGYVTTYPSNGSIQTVTLTDPGSGYSTIPVVRVQSNTGSGAQMTVVLAELNPASEITGRVQKTSIGKARGYWSTTRSFLNSDKYIQDSQYYQDYSYEVRVNLTLENYKNILYQTFHTAGTELFGKFLLKTTESSVITIVSEQENANTIQAPIRKYALVSDRGLSADDDCMTVDRYFYYSSNGMLISSDLNTVKSDSITVTSDNCT